MTLTPLENTILNAYRLASGLTAATLVAGLLRKGAVADRGVLDRSLSMAARTRALKNARIVNDTLAQVAAIQEMSGISA